MVLSFEFVFSCAVFICGQKHWVLFPPEVAGFLIDRRGNAVHNAAPGQRPEDWKKRFPRLNEAWALRHEVVQEAGEVIFVPSGWYHQVHNMSDSVSINHNWLNASNVMHAWSFLQSEIRAVHDAIGDLRNTFDSAADYEDIVRQTFFLAFGACAPVDLTRFNGVRH